MGALAEHWDERGEQRDEVLRRTRATDAAGTPLMLTVVNLSPGGLMARSDAVPAIGDRLSLELPLLGRVAVEVRWALGGRIGGRFDRSIAPERYYALLAAMRG